MRYYIKVNLATLDASTNVYVVPTNKFSTVAVQLDNVYTLHQPDSFTDVLYFTQGEIIIEYDTIYDLITTYYKDNNIHIQLNIFDELNNEIDFNALKLSAILNFL